MEKLKQYPVNQNLLMLALQGIPSIIEDDCCMITDTDIQIVNVIKIDGRYKALYFDKNNPLFWSSGEIMFDYRQLKN